MRYSAVEIEQIRTTACKNNLTAPSIFWSYSAQHLRQICNGCGAEDAPEWVRDILTWIYRHYTAAHCIHDCDFELSDGADETLDSVNARFYNNCLLLWKYKYGFTRWVNPVALWGLKKIRLAYKALNMFSDEAWMDAYKKRLEKEVSL